MADMLGIRDASCADGVAVAWHKRLLGIMDCKATRFDWVSPQYADVFKSIEPGDVPATFLNLRTEGWLNSVLGSPSPEKDRRLGVRRSGNFAVASTTNIEGFLENLPEDILETSLSEWTDPEGKFTGEYLGPDGSSLIEHFEEEMALDAAARMTPRMSGQQMKLAMTLHKDGTLTPATYSDSTHILKPSGPSNEEARIHREKLGLPDDVPYKDLDVLAAAEWVSLELAEASGSVVEKRALIGMPHNLPPALLVERFDIPTPETADTDLMINQDFCSAARIPPEYKYGNAGNRYGKDGKYQFGPESGYERLETRSYSIEGFGKIIRKMSTDPKADSEELLRRALTAWLVLDTDLHFKNISFLKHFNEEAGRLTSVRLSPVYDVVSAVPFKFQWRRPADIGENQGKKTVKTDWRPSMSLPINSQKENLKKKDFLILARSLGIPQDRAEDIIHTTAVNIARRAAEIAAAPPDVLARHEHSLKAVQEITDYVIAETARFTGLPASYDRVEAAFSAQPSVPSRPTGAPAIAVT